MPVIKYSTLSSKIGVMYGRMLSPKDYKELISKKTVNDVAAYLKYNTYYENILKNVNESTIHRGQLEEIFKSSLIDDYFKLFHYVRGNIKEFLKVTFLRYEVEDLKILLRVLNTEHNTSSVVDSLLFLKEYCTIDLERLSKSKDLQEFIQNLKGSKYYDILAPFIVNREYCNLFNIEMSLDLYFFSLVWKKKDKLLRGLDKRIITTSLGTEMDILNIFWIYRSKKYYNTPKEIIYSYVIPYNYKISKELLIKMVEAKDSQEVKELISQTKYKSIFSEKEDYYFDIKYTNYVYRLHKRLLKNNRFSIGSLISYLHLKEIEIRYIISVIEGIRYSLSPEEVKKNIFSGGF